PTHRLGRNEVRGLVHGRAGIVDVPEPTHLVVPFQVIIRNAVFSKRRGGGQPRRSSANDTIPIDSALCSHNRRRINCYPFKVVKLRSHPGVFPFGATPSATFERRRWMVFGETKQRGRRRVARSQLLWRARTTSRSRRDRQKTPATLHNWVSSQRTASS